VIAALLAAGCGGGGDEDEETGDRPSDATSTTVEATTTTLSVTEEVEAAFLAFNDMVTRLVQAPNPDDPEIAQRASGETLAGVTDSQTTLQTSGYRIEFGDRKSTEVIDVTLIDAGRATVLECSVDDRIEITPSESNGPFVQTYWTEWTLLLVDGVWLVDSSIGIERREGEHPCE
jgi:hypothetical protein